MWRQVCFFLIWGVRQPPRNMETGSCDWNPKFTEGAVSEGPLVALKRIIGTILAIKGTFKRSLGTILAIKGTLKRTLGTILAIKGAVKMLQGTILSIK